MNHEDRERFDALLESIIDSLPPGLRALIEEVPVIVDDVPPPEVLKDVGGDAADLLGLHTGVAITDEGADMSVSSEIRLFRENIVDQAGGFNGPDADGRVREEIRITLLHEIGHQFGLDENDLAELGFE